MPDALPMKPLPNPTIPSLAYLALGALSCRLSQATLSPIYGSIPAAVNHRASVLLATIFAYAIRFCIDTRGVSWVGRMTALWAFWIPVVQYYLFNFSGMLGPDRGPLLLSCLSWHTILIPAVYSCAARQEQHISVGRRSFVGSCAMGVIGTVLVVALERTFEDYLATWMTYSDVFHPLQLQLFVAVGLALLAPSRLLFLAIPAILHTLFMDPHLGSNSQLNSHLQPFNWRVLDRQWSTTGYISVLENLDQEYRMLRCDHSILGGEWQLTEERRLKDGWQVNEPIYVVFNMLEAVRLVERETLLLDTQAQALVIGLGIGTASKSLISHGVNTTIVELDPAVHRYAEKYFDLPRNNTTVIADAVQWTQKAATGAREQKFDYIIHDVFTGGAEPLPLFTYDFLKTLRSLMTTDGVIAINYAGERELPLTKRVLNTIDMVFDSAQCRIYRDGPSVAEADNSTTADSQGFSNIVVFCRNSPGPVAFRKPVTSDFLGSRSKQYSLVPDPSLEISFPPRNPSDRGLELSRRWWQRVEWAPQQLASALRHWRIMRKEVPGVIWELW